MAANTHDSRFVNRNDEIKVFTKAVRSIGDHADQLLTFYGVGGQGKTALHIGSTRGLPIQAEVYRYRVLTQVWCNAHGL